MSGVLASYIHELPTVSKRALENVCDRLRRERIESMGKMSGYKISPMSYFSNTAGLIAGLLQSRASDSLVVRNIVDVADDIWRISSLVHGENEDRRGWSPTVASRTPRGLRSAIAQAATNMQRLETPNFPFQRY